MVDSSQAYDHHAENEKIRAAAPTQHAETLPEKKTTKGTLYRVLKLTGPTTFEHVASDVLASSDIAALKNAGATNPNFTYVAVPERSFRLRKAESTPREPVVRYS